ncbi:MAG: GTA-gp10 family protein [Anaerolineae bacterium]
MGARGEITLQAGDREVQLLFTNRAIATAEEKLGKGIIEVLVRFEQGGGGITETAILLQAGMEFARREAGLGGRRVSLPQAFEVLDEAGFAVALAAIAEGIRGVLSYGVEDEEELPVEDKFPNA